MLFEEAPNRDELDAAIPDELVVHQRIANEDDLLWTQIVLLQNVLYLLVLREAGSVSEAPGEQMIDARALRMLPDKCLLGTAADEPFHVALLKEP